MLSSDSLAFATVLTGFFDGFFGFGRAAFSVALPPTNLLEDVGRELAILRLAGGTADALERELERETWEVR